MREALKVVIFGRNGEEVASIKALKGGDTDVSIAKQVDATAGTEIKKYIDVMQAALALGHGSYTGTIAPAGRGKKET